MEKMQSRDLLLGLQLPELDDLGQFIRSLPTSTLLGLGALTAVLAYWIATRPRPVVPPCDLRHQSQEVQVGHGSGVRRRPIERDMTIVNLKSSGSYAIKAPKRAHGRRTRSGRMQIRMQTRMQTSTTQPIQQCIFHTVIEMGSTEERPPLFQMEDGARRSMMGDRSTLLSYYHEDAKTMYEVFRRGLHITGDGPFLGSRLPNQPYKWLSYKEVFSRAEHLGSGLLSQGCQPNPDQFIGVFAQNRPEWIISELACYTYSMVVKATVLLENVQRGETPGLKTIILMDAFDAQLLEEAQKCSVHIWALRDALGREHYRKPVPPDPDDLSIVCFTSGTTGDPKGVMLTHGNVVADFGGFLKVTDKVIFPNQDDVLISFLPLAHMFERLIEALRPTIFPVVPRLLNRMYDKRWLLNFAAKRKGLEVSRGVIRCDSVWDKIFFHKIQVRAAAAVTREALAALMSDRSCDLLTGQSGRQVTDDHHRSGSRVPDRPGLPESGARVSGEIPGRPWLPVLCAGVFLTRPTLCVQVYEAYGQTECTAGCTFTTPGDWTAGETPNASESQLLMNPVTSIVSVLLLFVGAGHVGAPLPCNLIKLVDVAEKNYFAAKGEGEICVKGPNVFKGYLKDPVRTAETLDADGWLHTGDIGKWLLVCRPLYEERDERDRHAAVPLALNIRIGSRRRCDRSNGTLKIIDRKKHIFKLAQGEYISPEKIESIYIRSEPVSQLYVHGDSLQSCLVGIVVPDPEVLPSWAQKKGFDGCYDALCDNIELKKAILDDMVRLGKASGLHSFEQVKDIHIHKEMFSIQNGLLTPTLKAKRPELKEYFKTEIEQLYSNISM
ncbi:Long-chain-fatty-acid--CoA ligase 6 [Labeo rohita]|uniref:long-chain-fatty-acid--CoA ligase n=1 Tax=Labeo rohita TaxID=84645 RepID=A0ABQ8LJR2_LABRO|nr:Long-chain-fatty-acid--CoA ligase 6 [Labeo rohita]